MEVTHQENEANERGGKFVKAVPPVVAADIFRHDGFKLHQRRPLLKVVSELIRQPVNQVIVLAVGVRVIDNRAERGSALSLARRNQFDGRHITTKQLQLTTFLSPTNAIS